MPKEVDKIVEEAAKLRKFVAELRIKDQENNLRSNTEM